MPASLQAPGKAAQAASKTAKCLGMTTLKDMLIWLEGLDTTLQPVSFSMVFRFQDLPNSSKAQSIGAQAQNISTQASLLKDNLGNLKALTSGHIWTWERRR